MNPSPSENLWLHSPPINHRKKKPAEISESYSFPAWFLEPWAGPTQIEHIHSHGIGQEENLCCYLGAWNLCLLRIFVGEYESRTPLSTNPAPVHQVFYPTYILSRTIKHASWRTSTGIIPHPFPLRFLVPRLLTFILLDSILAGFGRSWHPCGCRGCWHDLNMGRWPTATTGEGQNVRWDETIRIEVIRFGWFFRDFWGRSLHQFCTMH